MLQGRDLFLFPINTSDFTQYFKVLFHVQNLHPYRYIYTHIYIYTHTHAHKCVQEWNQSKLRKGAKRTQKRDQSQIIQSLQNLT